MLQFGKYMSELLWLNNKDVYNINNENLMESYQHRIFLCYNQEIKYLGRIPNHFCVLNAFSFDQLWTTMKDENKEDI